MSCNDILSFYAVCFTEWGEVSVRGKHQPAYSTSILFNFLSSGLVETWGCFLKVGSSYTCNYFVVWPCNRLWFHLSHLCTPVCALLCSCWVLFSTLNVLELKLLLFCAFRACICVWHNPCFGIMSPHFSSASVDLFYVCRFVSCAESWMPPRKRFPPWRHSWVQM